MIDPKLTRGYLNNNPGNMDRGEQPWQGEIRDIPPCQNNIQRMELTHGRFCVFENAVMGIRAMAKNLLAYHDRLGCDTVREYIERWAPPNENNTQAYIAHVAARIGCDSDSPIEIRVPKVMAALIDGIIRVECGGMPYEDSEIIDGMKQAGIG
jgi:hypothetical protein